MPKKLDKELRALKKQISAMGELAVSMFQDAVQALVTRDESVIQRVLQTEEKVDQFQVDIDEDAIKAMAKFGPVATDLRFLLMAARITSDLERIGDQAVNMCEEVQLLISSPQLKPLVDIPRMAETAGTMLRLALQAFEQDSPALAQKVIASDDEVDALNDQIFRELLTYMMDDRENVKRCVALILTARFLERIADHATNIAEEVIFMVKGEDIRHQDD